ncbi:MAG: hypothetical protein N0E40_19230 [Candidatus Thiodiazotropha taylori]|nr:hypothetical protein [Candidatus Thiodiazotropha taylori]MCG8051899.1 hypothetical protein [Candidatus Thiodiazotropha taylori]MCW4306107.1 hypothetical protein [Candidatus Thiodiazotropha taylori]MCW4313718.1 hypothetical protein [Candidatus Thiodiazotropha taylori]
MKIIPLILAVVLLPSVLQADPYLRWENRRNNDFIHALLVYANLPNTYQLTPDCRLGDTYKQTKKVLYFVETGPYQAPACTIKIHNSTTDKQWKFYVYYSYAFNTDGVCMIRTTDKKLVDVMPELTMKISQKRTGNPRNCVIIFEERDSWY